MFKFNFSSTEIPEETEKTLRDTNKTCPPEADGKEIEILNIYHQNVQQYRDNCSPTTVVRNFHLVDVKHVEELITSQSGNGEFESLKTAFQMNSDIISGVYEGGMKIWECTLDLLDHLEKDSFQFDGLNVLDLGCGSGLLGMYALSKGALSVHFQDYNAEVLSLCTIPNVILNNPDLKGRAKFFAGDWGSLLHKLDRYDIILTSETIYNPENYEKLIRIFEKTLKKDGVIYVSAKHFYFGVGGNLYEFEKLIRQNKRWEASICFCSSEGVKREILKISQSTIQNFEEFTES